MKPTVVEVEKVGGIGWHVFVTLPQRPRKAFIFFQSMADANDEACRLHRLCMAFWNRRSAGEKPVLTLGQEDDG